MRGYEKTEYRFNPCHDRHSPRGDAVQRPQTQPDQSTIYRYPLRVLTYDRACHFLAAPLTFDNYTSHQPDILEFRLSTILPTLPPPPPTAQRNCLMQNGDGMSFSRRLFFQLSRLGPFARRRLRLPIPDTPRLSPDVCGLFGASSMFVVVHLN